ncbi:MAG TPA: T-complex 10 C-terminal domain-containing protein [Verrucomicrobiae bacterium]|nr:T-complex 10 C-terminal domain-containing protein [Verrucomicrobiae bacterium]
MKKMFTVFPLLAFALSLGCNHGKNEVLADGTKLFGERTQTDGTKTVDRIEFTDGTKQFQVIYLADGSEKIGRIEFPNGQKDYQAVAVPPNGFISTVAREEFPDGQKHFNKVRFTDGTQKIERVEFPNGEKKVDVTLLPDGTEKLDLSFRGLHSGQCRDEVESVLKQQGAIVPLDCEKPSTNGTVSCKSSIGAGTDGTAIDLSFSPDNTLIRFEFRIFSHAEEDVFYSSLRRELATANHKDGEAEALGNDPLSRLAANMGARTFTWDTPQKAVCLFDQEKECPAQQIRLDETHPCFKNLGCTATVTLTDNAFLTAGWVKKDKNRPQPKVAGEIVFMGLQGGDQRSQVGTILQKNGYKSLGCKYDAHELERNCQTSSGSHRLDLTFVHDRLAFFRFHYPASEHDAVYQNLLNTLGQPTDFSGKPGDGVYSWSTERTISCDDWNGNPKQCTADLLMLSSDEVSYADSLLENMKVREKTVRMLKASHRY